VAKSQIIQLMHLAEAVVSGFSGNPVYPTVVFHLVFILETKIFQLMWKGKLFRGDYKSNEMRGMIVSEL
jgi:hypothetical protein